MARSALPGVSDGPPGADAAGRVPERAPYVQHAPAPQAGILNASFWMCVLLCFAVLCCAITTSSLWIDEGFSAWVASHNKLTDVFATLSAGDVSDRQMPLHYFWLWVWSHGMGSSEASLRAANLPFAAVFVLALAMTSAVGLGRRFSWMPFVLSPFAWFYLNEARAYFMLIAFSTAAYGAFLVYLFGAERYRATARWLFLPAMLLAGLTHMLAGFLLPAVLTLAWWRHKQHPVRWAEWTKPFAVFSVPLLALGGYYLANLSRNTAYEYGLPSPAHFAMALYEHLGFLGLGPPRNLLRTLELRLFLDYWPWLLIGVVILAGCALSAVRQSGGAHRGPLLLAWCISFGCAIAAAYVVNSRFLGRHIAALLPVLLFAAMSMLTSRRQWIALALLWGLSDARLRLIPDYSKDDYRSAVRDVVERQKSRPGLIAWSADPLTANYYGLGLEARDAARYYEFDYTSEMRKTPWRSDIRGVITENWDAEAVESLLESKKDRHGPLYVALSKPDIYDVHGGWARLLTARHAIPVSRYASFDIYLLE